MVDTGFAALRRALNGIAPDGLRALEPGDLEHLAAAVRESRHRQNRALAEAGDHALRHVPRLLRGPIRRLTG